ncbi:MAG TPA: 2-hydroxyglutaryl-CoA dehydratase [Actinobacteria bacterium]|nr:2-hydroxyglutaryl-CoA dehydratase [Actinomycetota bacterium]
MSDITLGIDLGSTYTKAVLVDEAGEILATHEAKTGFHFQKAAERALDGVLDAAGLDRSDVDYVATTGFGRYAADLRDLAITELTCHAYAVHRLYPEVRTVLDVGGQLVKAIRMDEHGRVQAFRLNDKCAAGSGAFLEKTVRYLGHDVNAITGLSELAENPVSVSSVCAVFAESEIINHLAAGEKEEDVTAGAVVALAGRAAQVLKRVKPEPPCALTGGLTRVPLVRRTLEENLGFEFVVPDRDLGAFAGAYGAGLLAHQRLRKVRRPEPATV